MDDVLAGPGSSVTVPGARQLRTRLRLVRRGHRSGALADALTDAYIVVLVVGFYAWASVRGLRDYLGSPPVARTDSTGRAWIVAAAAVVAVGFAWQALRAAGPLLVGAAEQTWLVSSPVDRRAWLRPRFLALVVGGTAAAGVLGFGAAATLGAGSPDLAWSAAAGAMSGAGAVALSVVAQASPIDPRWARLISTCLFAAGTVVTVGAIAVHLVAGPAAGPVLPTAVLTVGIAVAALPFAAVTTIRAARVLGRVDRSSLTAGAEMVGGALAAAMMMDQSILSTLVETRRWRSVGRVRSHPVRSSSARWLRSRGLRLVWALARSDLYRLWRRRSALVAWCALLLVMYAVVVALPPVSGTAQLILAYLAVGRLTGGLRTISHSPGLRRSLGGRDAVLRLAHIIVPGIGALLWFAATLPVTGLDTVRLDAVLALGVVVAAYRAATKPMVQYGGPAADTPFGLIPVSLLKQLFRGPDILAVLVFVRVLVT